MPRKNKGTSGVQARVHEFVKKLHPNVLRYRLQSIRDLVISSSGERKAKKEEQTSFPHPTTSNAFDVAANSRVVIRENRNLPLDRGDIRRTDRKFGRFIEKFGNNAVDLTKTQSREMDISVPDVIIQDDSTKSIVIENQQCCETNSLGSSLQLLVDVENAPRNKSPVTVQEWVDSLPVNPVDATREDCETSSVSVAAPVVDAETDTLTLGAEAGCLCDSKQAEALPLAPVNVTITSCKEPSEVESHCSSVDSLLEARKPDPEEILLSLGFGGTASTSDLETGRIPKRFLSPSQMKGVDIEEFIRQQQDLIYTYESGYYGYRGLAGSPHSNPSVIVAKILEKLRDHEKGTALMNCFPPDFRKLSMGDRNSEKECKKFSKVARNVLTKIRCTPGSVLSPDNRRWLDSQGKKSPEINRRLILGQKSFTFGNDGALIESSNTTSNNGEIGDASSSVPQAEIPVIGANSRTTSKDEVSSESRVRIDANILPVDGGSATEIEDDVGLLNKLQPDRSMSDSGREASDSTNILNDDDRGAPANIRLSELNAYSSASAERFKFAVSLPECESDALASGGRKLSMLQKCPMKSQSSETDRSSTKKTRNVLTRCSSFEESVRSSSDEELLVVSGDEVALADNARAIAEKFDQFSDSATESEFASYPDRTPFTKNIRKQYEELSQLESKLRNIGQPISIISENQFASISVEQRTALQLSIVREALKIYSHELTKDEINLELKNCLTSEARKVADLLDSTSDSSNLCVIVRQMTLLLQHQSQLSAQIKEFSNVGNKPSSCHEMCGHILKRIQELESLVKRNEQELAQMKFQLLNKE